MSLTLGTKVINAKKSMLNKKNETEGGPSGERYGGEIAC